ncbi:hypothetical protein J6590_097753 [Homalodisca vitripennis]|nr:hypothetical protein J6590_097753 [Homalodisca vitripennis]
MPRRATDNGDFINPPGVLNISPRPVGGHVSELQGVPLSCIDLMDNHDAYENISE